VGKPLRLPGGYGRLRGEELHAEINGVIEVEAVLGEHPLLVLGVHEGGLALRAHQRVVDAGVGLGPRSKFRRRHQFLLGTFQQFEELTDPLERSLGMEEVGRALRQQDVAHQLPLAHLGDDAKPLWNAAEPAVLLQEALGEGVVGEDESLAGRKVIFLLDAIEHLAGGFFGEGEEQDALGGNALLA
jgi:hypothetical protein